MATNHFRGCIAYDHDCLHYGYHTEQEETSKNTSNTQMSCVNALQNIVDRHERNRMRWPISLETLMIFGNGMIIGAGLAFVIVIIIMRHFRTTGGACGKEEEK